MSVEDAPANARPARASNPCSSLSEVERGVAVKQVACLLLVQVPPSPWTVPNNVGHNDPAPGRKDPSRFAKERKRIRETQGPDQEHTANGPVEERQRLSSILDDVNAAPLGQLEDAPRRIHSIGDPQCMQTDPCQPPPPATGPGDPRPGG